MESARSVDEAMARYGAGDDTAFVHVYTAIAPCLTRFLQRRLPDGAPLPDLVQETLLRIHRARASFVPGSSVLPWALTIARRLLISAYRSASRERRAMVEHAAQIERTARVCSPPTGEQTVAAKQMAARLDRALAALPARQRAAIEMVHDRGLSASAAATALGTTTAGINLRTHRVRRTLRAELAAHLLAA